MTTPFTKHRPLPQVCAPALLCLGPTSPSRSTLPLAPVVSVPLPAHTGHYPPALLRPNTNAWGMARMNGSSSVRIRHRVPFWKGQIPAHSDIVKPYGSDSRRRTSTEKRRACENEALINLSHATSPSFAILLHYRRRPLQVLTVNSKSTSY
ncbi:hypothetical protein B0H13DRAFT_2073034 [Mycena leptocephala]|nr:hypothetical protein B0H13DRAFT_2073034 [Mycena leptocephala]